MNSEPSLDALLKCAQRELAYRKRTLSPIGRALLRMTQEKADREIACMRAIARSCSTKWPAAD